MVVRKVWLIPFCAVLLGSSASLLGLTLSVIKGHFPQILPPIRIGGLIPPEDCVFSQLLHMSSFFLIVTIYLRHRQIVEYYGHRLRWENSRWRTCSLVFMWIGLLAALGVTIIASFPKEEQPLVYHIGTTITFLSMITYAWGQVVIGYVMIPRMASMLTNHIRLILVLVSSTAFFLYVSNTRPLPMPTPTPPPTSPPPTSPSTMTTSEGTSTTAKPSMRMFDHMALSAERLMIISVQLFILSFVSEMRFAYAHAPRVQFNRTNERPALQSVSYHNQVSEVEVPTEEHPPRGTSDW